MIDASLLRKESNVVARALGRRGFQLKVEEYHRINAEIRALRKQDQELRAQRNTLTREIGKIKSAETNNPDHEHRAQLALLQKESSTIGEDLSGLGNKLRAAAEREREFMLGIPNIPHESVPDGQSELDNIELRRHGQQPHFDYQPRDHTALGRLHGGLDFELASNLAQTRFVVLAGSFARLHRVLAQFMLDLHTGEHGYQELWVPYLVNTKTMIAAGQLPKFSDQIFSVNRDDLHLIPTAEVPLVGMVLDQLIDPAQLPLKYVAHTPSFRREAGSYGRDTRGMIRQHQFDKVELVQVSDPELSYEALTEIVGHAEKVLQLLEIPYRVVELCACDLGEAAAKTLDLEAWLPSQQNYREISSCSNTADYQARRLRARTRNLVGGGTRLVHTLNGSGLAVGRTLIALIENHQQEDGSITLPTVLQRYMGGCALLTPPQT